MLRAADSGDEGERALAELCATYWPPVYHYFRRTTGVRHRAEDLTQGLFERLLALRNDVGLLSEEFDTRLERLIGNFPQAFSHVALVTTAHNLSRATKPSQQRAAS